MNMNPVNTIAKKYSKDCIQRIQPDMQFLELSVEKLQIKLNILLR